jgi:hypothetical protein
MTTSLYVIQEVQLIDQGAENKITWMNHSTTDASDEILKSLASGARKPVTSKYSNTTAQLGSYHRASFTHSNQLNINHSLAKIAYE